MLFRPSHRRLALWGQRLQSYLPPFSPAGLVGGHAMMRYAVSGQSTCSSSSSVAQCTPLPLSQLQAHIYSSDWQPSAAPVEVIWNANDAKAFHHVTPASAEDVAVCTEYLVRRSVAAAADRSQLRSVVDGKDLLEQSSDTPGSAARTAMPPTQVLNSSRSDLEHTVSALLEVVQTHRHLLAGAESLQTGVPLSYLLTQLSEAEAYLAWCCPSLAVQGNCHEPSNQQQSSNANTAGPHSFSIPSGKGGKDTGRNIEAAAQRRALRGDFDAEVRCLQEQLSSLSAAPASFTTTTAPPLISIITPTCNSLASAIKAAAVTWAATHDAVVDVSCGLKTAVLWRPAAETALSAVWMAVLLRRSLQSTGETEVMLQKEEKKGPSTPAVSAAATDKPLLSSKGAAKAVGGATSASLFHILVTGGDTAAHFVAPWVAGVQKAQHALSASLNSSRGAEVVDSSSCSSSTSSSASALCQNGTQGAYRLQPLLLCYGCPDAQVSHLRASLPGLTHNSNEPSCKVKDIVALENEIDWTPNVVELRTEVPTTGLVLPAAADPIADEPSAVAAAVVVSCDACAGNAPDGVLRAAAAAGRLKPTPRRMKVASSFALLHHVSSTAPQNGRSIEVVAKDVFNRAILQPPFLRRFTHTTDLPSTAADASAFGAVSVAMSALSSPYSVPVTVPGWCSLSFMDDSHAAALLRCLVQHHWKEPHYMGHSLAAPSRRGPLPSQAHALLLREALRDATTGACSSVSRAAARKEEEKEEGDDQIVWRHVCGGFALPLTATAGRESPYLLPGLLVCDLAATMTAQQQRDLACFLSSPTDAEQKEAKECRRDELDSCVLQAVQRVRRCVAALTQRYDTPERGYGDAVGGNLLFLCRYPAELAATVQAALTEGG